MIYIERGSKVNNSEKKGNKKKGIIAIIITVLLIAGGGTAAFVLSNVSGKQAYFLAEKNTMEAMSNFYSERYKGELDWNDVTYEKPTDHAVELSAEYNGPTNAAQGYDTVDPAQIINNSSITLNAQSDMNEKEMAIDIAADISGLEIDGIETFLTDEKLVIGLPFLDDMLQITEEDFGPLLHELDPMSFTGEESMDLNTIFEKTGPLTEDEIEHFKEEYGKAIYDELPDDAFTSSEETIVVNGDEVKTEKVELHLTEQQVKDILSMVLEKMEKDEIIKGIIETQIENNLFAEETIDQIESNVESALSEYETAISTVREGIEDDEFVINNGFNSTIWVHDDTIVQRELSIELGKANELVSLEINGTQLVSDSIHQFDYDFNFADEYTDGTMNIAGELTWEDNKASDSINLTVDEYVLSYDGNETLEDGTRDFDRTFSFKDPTFTGSLIWEGSSTYDKDQMNAEHQFSVESPEIAPNLFNLYVSVDGKQIDSVEMPNEENIVDLGKMSLDELAAYVESDINPKFQNWLFQLMSTGGIGF